MDKKLPSPKFLTAPSEAKNSSYGKSNKILLMPGLVGSGIPQIETSPGKPIEEFVAPRAPLQKSRRGPHKTEVPYFSSPEGMLMPSSMQPPPMYGPRGSTIPPKYLPEYKKSPRKDDEDCWCDVCDTNFPSSEELGNHKNEHKVCGVDGCSFIGDPKTLASHLEATHNSGLYSKVKKLSTPEEISKWREDRRKKYPTSKNIELRRKFQEAKMKRGEKIEKTKSRFGRPEDRRRMNNQNQGPDHRVVLRKPKVNLMKNKKKETSPAKVMPKVVKKEVLETDAKVEDSFFKGKLPPFKGTSLLEDYKRPKIKPAKINPLANILSMYASDDDSTESGGETDEERCEEQNIGKENLTKKLTDNETEQLIEHPKINECFNNDKGLSSKETDDKEKLLQEVFSAPKHPAGIDSSDDKVPQDISLKKVNENIKEDSLSKFQKCISPAKIDSSDDEMPEEIPAKRIKENIEEESKEPATVQSKSTATHNSKKRTRRKRGNNLEQVETQSNIKEPKKCLLNYSKLKTSRQNTMLEKLLEPDIRHERNILLQCVRYVVENKFFGIGSKEPY